MSKLDAVRALREARYDRTMARAKNEPATKRARPPVAPPAPVTPVAEVAEVDDTATEELCGHRNMSGRTCTRERGHAAKSHRYG
jgi:hypothetical protein